jgi:hypothetical protein
MTTVPNSKCGAKTRNGTRCQQAAGWGTPHGPTRDQPGAGRCRLHGGMSPSGLKAAEREAAEHAVEVYGLPRDVDPHDALKAELARTNGHVCWLAALIAGFESRDELKQLALGEGAMWEKPAVWLQLYMEERKHLTKLAEVAIRCGIAEREIRLAEEEGAAIAKVISGVLAECGVIPTDEVRGIVRRHLGLVTADAASLN